MESINEERYYKGKVEFCILIALTAVMFLLSGLFSAGDLGGTIYLVGIMLLTRMYWGDIWPLFFIAVLAILEGMVDVAVMAAFIREIGLVIRVWPGRFILGGIRVAICLSMYVLIIFGKNLRYFVKVKKMERKQKKEKGKEEDNDNRINQED
ncbi:hypothetical protein D3Z50_11715 [Clostridiaceae bacterium]|nr:hypothetical protein [Clostridiaceae bacterium]